MKIRTYSKLSVLKSYHERFEYLKLNGSVGKDTFGFDRYLNQKFYSSAEWKRIRDIVIARDNGCDLGIEGYEIYGKILVHHMNPIVVADILDATEFLIDPEYLIAVSHTTHNAIHYGTKTSERDELIVRRKNDTCPWRH